MATIRVSPETKTSLAKLGNKGDSYEDIILGLIDYYYFKEKELKK